MSRCIKQQVGFTLIEVLIAMSIIAISLVSAIQLSNESARGLSHLEEKTIAHWVAESALSDIVAGSRGYFLSAGTQKGVFEEAGRQWPWLATIRKQDNQSLEVVVNVLSARSEDILDSVTVVIHENKQIF